MKYGIYYLQTPFKFTFVHGIFCVFSMHSHDIIVCDIHYFIAIPVFYSWAGFYGSLAFGIRRCQGLLSLGNARIPLALGIAHFSQPSHPDSSRKPLQSLPIPEIPEVPPSLPRP